MNTVFNSFIKDLALSIKQTENNGENYLFPLSSILLVTLQKKLIKVVFMIYIYPLCDKKYAAMTFNTRVTISGLLPDVHRNISFSSSFSCVTVNFSMSSGTTDSMLEILIVFNP